VWGEKKPGYWVVDAPGNAAAIAVNRIVAAGAAARWTNAPISVDGFEYPAGSIVVPYVKGAEPVMPKIAAELGLRVDGVKGKPPAGTDPIGRARVAVYKPWVENIDEGWTRWVLEQYEFKFATITDADIRAGNLGAKYDAIVLPNAPADRLVSGNPAGSVPAEYAGGLGPDGVDALRVFVRGGGTLVCLAQSGGLAIAAFELPISDVTRDADDRLFVPGSILKLRLDPSKPLAYGMRPDTAAFFAFSSAFDIAPAPVRAAAGHGGDVGGPSAIETIARYGDKDILLSGWLEGESLIASRAAALQATIGTGRVVLFGFPVQHRGQSHATFRLLFNALFTAR
jgi:hypothetical protein